MKLLFNLEYETKYGEELMLNVIADGGVCDLYKMATLDGRNWSCEVMMPLSRAAGGCQYIDYYYSLVCDGVEQRHEWLVVPHRLEFAAAEGVRYTIYDHWIDIPDDSYMYSSAFTECVAKRCRTTSAETTFSKTVRLKVRAPQLRCGERLAVVGGTASLGFWNARRALPMTEHENNEWVLSLDADELPLMFEFKFLTLSDATGVDAKPPVWENGLNRTVCRPEMEAGEVVVYELTQAYFPVWPWRGAGTVIPVFSLRSEGSFGVGDFGDLKKMVDWCEKTKQSILQVLPVNDTTISHTWQDSYPYNSISIYALHPQYTDLRQLPALKDEALRQHFETLRQELNALPKIDYERVMEAKTAYLREAFKQEWPALQRREGYKRFFAQNSYWLEPYAAFCYFRDLYGTASFAEWPEEATLDSTRQPQFKGRKELQFWYFVQYCLDQQMRAAHDYARAHRVILKGDIPIGISRDGVEAWVEPRYFNLNGQAGAPPDAFSANGQNWGFPTYNWDEMLSDGCSWWVRRFKKMQEYFDAYRIDHVLGFFRIWEIPIDAVHGLLGQFSPALAMSREEIENVYGLPFREEFLRPYIADDMLLAMFGDRAQYVKDTFLDPAGGADGRGGVETPQGDAPASGGAAGRWQMKPAFDTQRKVEAWFKNTDDGDVAIRDGLYALISNVLFVRDRKEATMYHPRISAQLDYAYKALNESEKFCFNRLYNDYFYRRNNQFWYEEAMKKLPCLTEATRMLVCAEDLGMVPDCVPWVMEKLRILSLEIQSMPKSPNNKFGHLSQYPYRSVCTIFTHDMPTLRQWWDEDRERTQEYYTTMLHRSGEAPHPLPGWLAKDIVSRHLTSPSMLCLISLQDWLATDEDVRVSDEQADTERINIPANPRHYWRYRMHMTLEQLLAADEFNEEIATLIGNSGRR